MNPVIVETVGDLIAALEDLGDETPLYLAKQPSWPLEHRVGTVVVAEVDGERRVYISEGEQVGYLPGTASEELGWA
ncbi:hypothetical protein [Micromonospora sp. WMMC273]|uniref:hypothetical protein n=1 Tax=Micromonospora sp. WMMC273 TaxID=3015157 RepID=UPI0022B68205|nr:hypothetical protein [Micromonospora sp. WMMC273]MCZ7478898.1 hypothetical protein [Micromonospora sp. WMMC273]